MRDIVEADVWVAGSESRRTQLEAWQTHARATGKDERVCFALGEYPEGRIVYVVACTNGRHESVTSHEDALEQLLGAHAETEPETPKGASP